MKKLAKGLLLVIVLLLLASLWMFWPVRLPVAELQSDLGLPPAAPPPSLTLYRLPTGAMHSQAMFAYRGGAVGEPRDFAMTAYLVRHPRGDLLIDTGLGSQVDQQFARLPWLMRHTSRYSTAQPAGQQLAQAGIEPEKLAGVLLTHAHWDHVSGLTDLPGATVWLSASEEQFVAGGAEMAALASSLTNPQWRSFKFDDGPYLGYPRSHDWWGDGSVVVVPAAGHTPGSVHVFVNLPDGGRYLFVGDTVWQREAVERPAERPWLAQRLVDNDAAQVRAQISLLAALQRRFPELIIVPAHDARPAEALPLLVYPSAGE